jgi:hypothetical protein
LKEFRGEKLSSSEKLFKNSNDILYTALKNFIEKKMLYKKVDRFEFVKIGFKPKFSSIFNIKSLETSDLLKDPKIRILFFVKSVDNFPDFIDKEHRGCFDDSGI